jgi:hypothetical protein
MDGGGQAAGPIGEPYRPRFSISLDFAGELIPDETITLYIEGVANGKPVGGDVRVMLPTFAAMDHAGTDKHPNYPIGKEIPTAAGWDLPIMDAGATWKRSVEIKLPEKGYYQVAVLATVEAPDQKEDPFVFDVIDHERWLLVMEGGGFVTHYLDESRLPANVVPSEGPFRTKRRGGAAHRLSGYDANADSDDGIALNVTYYANGRRRSARDAEVRIRYMDQGDDMISSYTTTVPSSGIVRVSCPDAYEYVIASVLVVHTVHTSGQHVIGGTEVYDDDCGTTRNLVTNAYRYMPWRHLNDAIPEMEDYFDQYRGPISWEMRFTYVDSTFYWPNSDRISFDYNTYSSAIRSRRCRD